MQIQNIDNLFAIDPVSFEDPSTFSDDGKYSIDAGMYTGVVVGWGAFKHVYEGVDKGTSINMFWQVQNKSGNVINLRGNRWTISSNEKANFRKDLAEWFGVPANDWGKIVEILKKKKVFDPKVPSLNMDAFIGAKATLMITNKTSKNGKQYPEIVSMSKADPNVQVPVADIPAWLVKDALSYKLLEGVQVAQPKKKAAATNSGEADAAPAASSGQPNAAAAGIPDKLPGNVPDDAIDDLPFN